MLGGGESRAVFRGDLREALMRAGRAEPSAIASQAATWFSKKEDFCKSYPQSGTKKQNICYVYVYYSISHVEVCCLQEYYYDLCPIKTLYPYPPIISLGKIPSLCFSDRPPSHLMLSYRVQ